MNKDFYLIRSKSGDIDLETFEDLNDAKNEIKLYERGDKKLSEYIPNNYKIVKVKNPKYYSAKSVTGNKMIKKKVVKKSAPKKAVKKTTSKKVVKKTAIKKKIGLNTIKPNQATIDKYSKKSSLTIKRLDPKLQIIKDISSVLNNISSLEKNIFNLELMIKDLKNKNIKTSLKKDLLIYKSLLKERKIEYKEIKKLL